MEKILGLDLGTNSIGWAIRDTSEKENQIISTGVLTFDKGVGEGKSGEFPLVQKRTESRGKRRNYQAEKYRKWALLETLITKKMCPLTIGELDEWRKYTKGVIRKYPQSSAFVQWLRFDFDGDGKPDFERLGFNKHESYYLFRKLIVSEEDSHKKIFRDNPNILGRVLYQLVQRRGYRGRDDEDEEAKTIMQGSEKNGTKGAEIILPLIQEYNTLGAALYHLSIDKKERIRKRYNLRSNYEHELSIICKVQNIDATTQKKLWRAIIWQRPLRSQKGLVGFCTLEAPVKEKNKFIKAGKKRCPVSHPLYEEFRTWVFINNLKIQLPEDIDKVKVLSEHIYPLFYKTSRDFKLSSINKEIKKLGGSILSKHSKGGKNKEEDTKVISCTFLNSLKDIFGNNWKNDLGWNEALFNKTKPCKYSFEDIWHIQFSFDSIEKLKEFATEKLKLDEDKAEKFSKIKLQQGYATLSLSAIKKILPYLYQGFIYSEAVYLANLPKVLNTSRKIDIDFIKTFSSEVSKIIHQQNHDKELVMIINSLISDQLNSEHRFGMDENYQIDEDDKKDILLKIESVIGSKTWELKSEQEKLIVIDQVTTNYFAFLRKSITVNKGNLFHKSPRLHDQIFEYLKVTYDIPDKNKKYLWHPSEQETYEEATTKNNIPVLGKPQPISNGFKNPMALKTLHKLRGLINYLLEIGKIDEDTRVVVEIARELNDSNKRKAIEKWQRGREKENNEFKKIIDEINEECKTNYDRENKILIDKIRLWKKEQNMQCLYTGNLIRMCDLFNDTKYDFEHTIPASMSFDNELKNLTIADAKYNRHIKGNRIPFDCPNYLTEISIHGILYKPIIRTLKMIFGEITIVEKKKAGKVERKVSSERTEQLISQIDFWVNESKKASTKDRKDYCIQQRHLYRFELEYWLKKLETFTCIEYKAGWRNNQLRDTQVVTKYALPYLKTIFRKTEVQKGSITDDFRKIYKIQPRLEKKNRDKHTHHAIDAAVLTLIPQAALRDKILLRYNEANDKNISYNEPIRSWSNFDGKTLKTWIEENTLINFQAQHRAITETYKNIRKRGKQQFVKEKSEDGKWQYKLDKLGRKIPLIAKGDTIRGNLHDDTFYGAIKQPEYIEKDGKFIPQTDGKGNFIFQLNEKRKDSLFFVTRHREGIGYLKKMEDLDLIIDPNLKVYLKTEIQNRINDGRTFIEAITEPIWAFGKTTDKNGIKLNPIRHIRTRVKGGGGGLINNPASIKQFESYISKQQYKQTTYAQNGETLICSIYQSVVNEESVREIIPYSILDISKIKDKSTLDEAVEKNIEKTIKKVKYLIPLYATLKINQKVLFYQNEIAELKVFSNKELSNRLYLIVKFEDGRISLKHHLNSMSEEDLKKEMNRIELPDIGASAFNFSKPIPKLRLSKSSLDFAIEDKHFEIKPDGEINWLI